MEQEDFNTDDEKMFPGLMDYFEHEDAQVSARQHERFCRCPSIRRRITVAKCAIVGDNGSTLTREGCNMKLNTILNIAAVVALLSTGVVKADSFEDCLNQATSASALIHSRDAGTPKENIANFIDTKQEPRFRPMLHRILNTAYGNPSLDREAAYNGELAYCMAHAPKEVKQKVADK